MKKAKNETVAEKETKVADNKKKTAESIKNLPSEKIRNKDKENRELNFKKVLYGYDPEEVASYIDELNETYESSSRIHESKLSSLKEELVLSNRERDSYGEKYRACKAKLDAASRPPEPKEEKEDKSAEYEAVIAGLKEKIEQMKSENSRLQQAADQGTNKTFDEFTGRIAALENENRQMGIRADSLKRENSQLLASAQKYDGLFCEYNAVLSQVELLKAELASKENEIQLLKEETEAKISEINGLSSENEENKKKAAELEVENGVLKRRIEENKEEISRLKNVNKKQAYEYADKINSLESEQAKSKLEMQKELKLHDYYINQAELTLAEFTKQMEQIKQSLHDVQSV